MTLQALAPAAFAVLAVVAIYYRRMRRLFGRQRVQPARMKFRIVFLFSSARCLRCAGSGTRTTSPLRWPRVWPVALRWRCPVSN